ncbi:hypothetical protein [Pseudophaeobacter sp. C1-32P7]|uniref:hypothetical protein n=1 Tax=Pseudophaeobacter sp. C1-32P7 TaxID=3098142 RepID=UPI0034D6A498
MPDIVKLARRAKGSDLLPKVSFGAVNAETLILQMADEIERLRENERFLRDCLSDRGMSASKRLSN